MPLLATLASTDLDVKMPILVMAGIAIVLLTLISAFGNRPNKRDKK